MLQNCKNVVRNFTLFDNNKILLSTIWTHINKGLWGFQGEELLKILSIKASKSGLLVQKSGGLFKFCCTGGLIKSGVLYASIR